KNISHHNGREQFQKVLHPQVHDPKSPKISGGEFRRCPRHESHGVKSRNREGGEKEEPGHVANMVGIKARAQTTKYDDGPKKQADRKQHLPETPDPSIQIPASRTMTSRDRT